MLNEPHYSEQLCSDKLAHMNATLYGGNKQNINCSMLYISDCMDVFLIREQSTMRI